MFKKKSKKVTPSRVRRQTISSSSGPVFSYHAQRTARPGVTGRQEKPQETSSLERRQQGEPLKRLKQLSVLLIVAGLLVSTLWLSKRATVVFVGDQKSQVFLRDRAVYEAAVQEKLASSVLNRNKLTINVDHLNRQLQDSFPELRSAIVSLPLLGHQPTVYVEAAVPNMVFITADGASYVLDGDGRALLSGSEISSKTKANLPVVVDQTGLRAKSGQIALPSDSVAFITEVNRQLRAKNITITSMVLPIGGSELDVRIGDVPYLVKFNLRGNAREEVGAYLAVKQSLEAAKTQPRQYIDVRVSQRVYYQ